jgi:acyl-coenzyme A thioesterase 9
MVVQYDFSTNTGLLDKYRNPWGYVRHGLLLEDLDALAGNTAAQHCADGDKSTLGPLLVTASVDSIRMKKRLVMTHDLTLTGSVAWVGRSSMLINMVMMDETTGELLMEAGFTFVARDRETRKSTPINRLLPETTEEVALFDTIEAREQEKKRLRQDETHVVAKRAAQDAAVRELLQQSKVLRDMPALVTDDVMLMSQTCLENSMICQPQQRNMADSIFGGFLMRRAFELAFSTCYLHGGSRPHFVELERVVFRTPVEIGDLLRLSAHVTYATSEPRPLVHVEVLASVVNPEEREAVVSNVFNFTFALNLHLEEAHNQTMKTVLPATEGQARRYLEGKEFVADNLVEDI